MKMLGLTFLFLTLLNQYVEASPSIYAEVIQIDDMGLSKVSCIPRGRGDKSIKEITLSVTPSYLEAYLRELSESPESYETAQKFIMNPDTKKLELMKSDYFYCEDLTETQVVSYIEENPDCVENSAGIRGIEFINKSLTTKVSNFTGKENRKYLSKDEKSKYNALGQIRVPNNDGNGEFIGSAQIVEIEGMPTNKTMVVTSAHVINSEFGPGEKEFCIGDDPVNPNRSKCYKIIDSIKGNPRQEGPNPTDWAVLVLEEKIDKIIVNGKNEKPKPFLIKRGSNSYTSLVSKKKITNVAYSLDKEKKETKKRSKTKAWPTKTSCNFRQKSPLAKGRTTDAMSIHDCHSEIGASGSAFVYEDDQKNYIYAINDGHRGQKQYYKKPFDDEKHYGRAVKVQGKFYEAIEELSQKYMI